MGIQKEVWLPFIQENLYKGFELVRNVAQDDSVYVTNATVHIPNAGAAADVNRDNTSYPVSISERTDTTITYDLHSFQMGPRRLGWSDSLQLSYNKMSSLAADFVGNINERIKDYTLSQWWTYNANTIVSTSGTATTTNWLGGSAAGSLKHLTGADVRSAAKILDRQKFPATERYLLLDPDQFWQLLGDMAYNSDRIEVVAGLSATVDTIYGFKVIQLPYVAAVSANTGTASMIVPGTDGSYSYTSTNRPAGLAFHKSAVSYAYTPIKVFTNSQQPEYFGDLTSAEIFGGGKYRRTDAEGVVAIRSTA